MLLFAYAAFIRHENLLDRHYHRVYKSKRAMSIKSKYEIIHIFFYYPLLYRWLAVCVSVFFSCRLIVYLHPLLVEFHLLFSLQKILKDRKKGCQDNLISYIISQENLRWNIIFFPFQCGLSFFFLFPYFFVC